MLPHFVNIKFNSPIAFTICQAVPHWTKYKTHGLYVLQGASISGVQFTFQSHFYEITFCKNTTQPPHPFLLQKIGSEVWVALMLIDNVNLNYPPRKICGQD